MRVILSLFLYNNFVKIGYIFLLIILVDLVCLNLDK